MAASRRTLSLALALTPGIGGKSITRILTRNDLLGRTVSEFLRMGPEALKEEYRLSMKAAQAWAASGKTKLDEAKRVEDRLEPMGVSMVTAADAHYPRRIEQMDPDPPGFLFFYGNVKLLEADTKCVMASRGMSSKGLALIEKLTEEAVLAGLTVVGGHDTPEYQRSSVVPLRWGAPRILVLDRGLYKALGEDLKDEPFRAARLWRYQFDPKTDLVVSSINPDRDYHPNSNRVRDKLVASLSLALDFVEARSGGNMESLAKMALRAGRPVRIWDESENVQSLRKLGATLLYSD